MRPLAGGLAAALAWPALAAEPCGGLGPVEPKVSVTVEPGEPSYDTTRSGAEIAELGAGGGLPGGEPLGLTRVEERVATRVAFQEVQRGDRWCVAPTTIEVTVHYPDTTVFIARRFEPGTCQYRVVRAHEDEHVRINRTALEAATGPIREAVRATADGWGWRHGEPETLRQAFQEEMRAALDGPLGDMRERRRQGNAEIDTLASYRALTAQCPDW